jgi:DNA-binding response OmpR family regulator
VPIIMLTGHGERSRVIEAVQVGVNEFLLKPVSSKALQSRMVSVLTKPRPMVQAGSYYGPVPRKMVATMNEDGDQALTNLVLVN